MSRPINNRYLQLLLLPTVFVGFLGLGIIAAHSADEPVAKPMAKPTVKPMAKPMAKSKAKLMTQPEVMAEGGYCSNILDAASEARAAFRLKKLKEIEMQIEKRIAALEEKSKEIKSWLERRENFMEKAQGQLVDIYKKMRPDAAALQISELDEMTAAAILLKLSPRTASTILNEMDPKLAARLASFVSYAAKKAAKKGQS